MQSPRHHTSSSSNIRAAVSVSVWSSSSQLSVVGTSKQAIHSSGLPDSRIARRAPTAPAGPRARGSGAAPTARRGVVALVAALLRWHARCALQHCTAAMLSSLAATHWPLLGIFVQKVFEANLNFRYQN